ncbi:MAG: hypothetical protein AAF485_17690 [Chloroflexota bacterium]
MNSHHLKFFLPILLTIACSITPSFIYTDVMPSTEEPIVDVDPEATQTSLSPTPTIQPSVETSPAQEIITLPISLYILDDEAGQFSSARTVEDLEAVYEKVNQIWAQAGIVLEIQTIERVSVPPLYLQTIVVRDFQRFFEGIGTDIELSEPGLLNGFYAQTIGGPNGIAPFGSRVFFVTDQPTVYSERVSSHEVGHLLGLHHVLDDPNRLMFSGTNGMQLSEAEIAVARYTAQGLLDGVR